MMPLFQPFLLLIMKGLARTACLTPLCPTGINAHLTPVNNLINSY
jgi:hypothetical protein